MCDGPGGLMTNQTTNTLRSFHLTNGALRPAPHMYREVHHLQGLPFAFWKLNREGVPSPALCVPAPRMAQGCCEESNNYWLAANVSSHNLRFSHFFMALRAGFSLRTSRPATADGAQLSLVRRAAAVGLQHKPHAVPGREELEGQDLVRVPNPCETAARPGCDGDGGRAIAYVVIEKGRLERHVHHVRVDPKPFRAPKELHGVRPVRESLRDAPKGSALPNGKAGHGNFRSPSSPGPRLRN